MPASILPPTHRNETMDKFKIGDTIVALRNIEFMDGTKHILNAEYVVSPYTYSYFNVNSKDYRLAE